MDAKTVALIFGAALAVIGTLGEHAMPDQPAPSSAELKTIETKRIWIVATSALALVVLTIAIFHAPAPAVVVLAVIILVAVKKAIVRYRDLDRRRNALLDRR